MSWKTLLKSDVMGIFRQVNEQASHLWVEAQQLPGTGEVNMLNSIVLAAIRRNLDKPNVKEIAIAAGENYVFGD